MDFEFHAPPGSRPQPLCVVARELRSGRLVRQWIDGSDGPVPTSPPYPTDAGALFVTYYGSAEVICRLELGWPVPERILDLYAEFQCHTAGLDLPRHGLLNALSHFGLPSIGFAEKTAMRDLAIRGGPYTDEEKAGLIDYCQSDVDALAELLPAMLPHLDLPHAIYRGRYSAAAARMERWGVPIDVATLERLRNNWDGVKWRLVQKMNADYGIYVPAEPHADPETYRSPMRFDSKRFADYLVRVGIAWPRLDSGALDLSDDMFREMARVHPAKIGPIREVRHALSQMKLNELAVGPDARNRTLLGIFGSKTGRNQPGNSKFIFGPSCWLRSLIQPPPGRTIAYLDWSAQELGIAAMRSGDLRMQEAYLSGDPYLWFGRFAKLLPPDATKKTHGEERDRLKVVMLGVLYGLSEVGLARRLDLPLERGRQLLTLHRETFWTFWSWSERTQDGAFLTCEIATDFGWRMHVGSNTAATSVRNFPMPAGGAEMMRLAACLATERGIEVAAPVHDAFLIVADRGAIGSEVERMQAVMREASEMVLPGFPLRADAKIVRHPERYSDDRGVVMWTTVMELMEEIEAEVRDASLLGLGGAL